MRYVDPREIIFPGICTKRGREGEGGGRREGRNEVFPPFVRRASFGSGEKTLQALLSLSYESINKTINKKKKKLDQTKTMKK